jgi:hypothetical protein
LSFHPAHGGGQGSIVQRAQQCQAAHQFNFDFGAAASKSASSGPKVRYWLWEGEAVAHQLVSRACRVGHFRTLAPVWLSFHRSFHWGFAGAFGAFAEGVALALVTGVAVALAMGARWAFTG